jgi:phytoene/squalene synthetase
LANIAVSGPQLALHGRVYFAAEDLRSHGVDQHISDGQHSDRGLRALLADYAQRARQTFESATVGTPVRERQALMPWLILNRLALNRVRKFERHGFGPEAEPVELPPLLALFTAWRAARHFS